MKLSRKWLNEFVDLSLEEKNDREFAEAMTLSGSKVEGTEVQGENIQTGMERIEGMLDKVIVAFQKQLDGLFARDLVDITADIRVMEQMLAQNGLTNDKDF